MTLEKNSNSIWVTLVCNSLPKHVVNIESMDRFQEYLRYDLE